MPTLVRKAVREYRLHTQRARLLLTFLAAVLGVLALVLGHDTTTGSDPSLVAIGVGSSLLASAFFLFLTASRQSLAQKFIDQGIQRSFLDRHAAFDNEDWSMLVRNANSKYRVLGVANHGYVRMANAAATRAAFKTILERNVDVEILWLHPKDPRMDLHVEEEKGRGTVIDTIRSIRWFIEFKEELSEEQKKHLVLKVYRKTPTCGITWVDDYLVVTHYLSTEPNKFAPGLVLTRDNGVFRSILTWQNPTSPGPQLAEKYISHYSEISGEAEREELPTLEQLDQWEREAERESRGVSEEDLG